MPSSLAPGPPGPNHHGCLFPVKGYEAGATFHLYNKTTLRIARDTPDTCKSVPLPSEDDFGFLTVSCRPDNVDARGYPLDACTIDCFGNLQCAVRGFNSAPFLWLFDKPSFMQPNGPRHNCVSLFDLDLTEDPDPEYIRMVVVPVHS